MCGNFAIASCMAMESGHVKQAQRLTPRTAWPLLALTIPCILTQQRQIHIRDLHPQLKRQRDPQKKTQHGIEVFLESLRLLSLSSVGRLSYVTRFKSVKTWSSALSTWAACSSQVVV